MKYIVYKIHKYLLKPFYRLIFLTKYIGVENIPSKGSFVFAGNHTSGMDAAMMVSTPKRVIHTLSKKELFKGKFKNWYFRNMACIPVERGNRDENAKVEVINTLNEGHAVGIFPEGTINKNPEEVDLLPFKKGAVMFAYKANAPIVPFAIVGKYRPFRRGLKVIYGKPYKVKTDDFEHETEILRNKILKLKKGDNYDEK
jgi:1-acyl-sn-glycerol-3-phosphate acyltransferase